MPVIWFRQWFCFIGSPCFDFGSVAPRKFIMCPRIYLFLPCLILKWHHSLLWSNFFLCACLCSWCFVLLCSARPSFLFAASALGSLLFYLRFISRQFRAATLFSFAYWFAAARAWLVCFDCHRPTTVHDPILPWPFNGLVFWLFLCLFFSLCPTVASCKQQLQQGKQLIFSSTYLSFFYLVDGSSSKQIKCSSILVVYLYWATMKAIIARHHSLIPWLVS